MNESGKSEFTVLAFPNQETKGEDIKGFLEEKAKKAVETIGKERIKKYIFGVDE